MRVLWAEVLCHVNKHGGQGCGLLSAYVTKPNNSGIKFEHNTYSSPMRAFRKVLFPQLCSPHTHMQMSFPSKICFICSTLFHTAGRTIASPYFECSLLSISYITCTIIKILCIYHNYSQQLLELKADVNICMQYQEFKRQKLASLASL